MALGLVSIIVSNYEMFSMVLLFKICLIDAYLFFSFIMIGMMTFENKEAVHVIDLNKSLKETLSDETLRKEFKRFLETEFSVELFDFWNKIQDYKHMTSSVGLELKANMIYSTYISKNSDFQINISHRHMEEIEKKIKHNQIDAQIFENAENQVFKLMRDNSFVRFYWEGSGKHNKLKF